MSTTQIRTRAAIFVLAGALVTPMLLPATAQAKNGGSPTVEARGTCTGGGTWKLKARHDDARIQVEYEIDTNRPNQLWHVNLTDNNVRIFHGDRRTTAPSGSFTVRTLTGNRAGIDTIHAHATMGNRSCGGTVRL